MPSRNAQISTFQADNGTLNLAPYDIPSAWPGHGYILVISILCHVDSILYNMICKCIYV